MKKIVASVGLVALGASSIQMQSAIAAPPGQPLSASVTLRGFYDDNINTAHSSGDQIETFGGEVSPSIGLRWSNDQTTLLANYTYSLKYYDKRPAGNSENYDQTHKFSLMLEHVFTERYKLTVQDSFVIGQEPDFLRAGSSFQTFQRISGDNIRNLASIIFNAEITPVFGLETGYENAFTDYADSFSDRGYTPPIVFPGFPPVVIPTSDGSRNVDALGNITPSRSGVLDRVEQSVYLDGRWQVWPRTVAVLGYKYSQINYTANEKISGVDWDSSTVIKSQDRNSRSHFAYVGADHVFRPDFSGSVRAGAQYIDFYNDSESNAQFSPYVLASLNYLYAPQSSVSAGFAQRRSATDIASVSSSGRITQDTDSSVLFSSLRHHIADRLFGRLTGTFQNNSFNGGPMDGETEQYYLLGVDLEYQINRHLSAHTGYNYDRLESDIANRAFDRNRVYVGITASY